MSHSQEHASDVDTRRSLLADAYSQLADAGREAPRRAAEWVLSDVLGCDRVQLHTNPGSTVSRERAKRFREMIARYRGGEPLQYVLGYTSFRGLKIRVTSAVMVPRPETEEVVDHALDMIRSQQKARVLDVGTGSGCIALAMKAERPDVQVYGWDVSAEALDVARSNAARLGLDVTFSEVDLFDPGAIDLEEPFTLLVSNPPYIPREEAESLPEMVGTYEPDVSLFSGDDPLSFYRAIANRVPALCTPGASIVLETHAHYADEAADLVRERGLTNVRIRTDLADRPRVIKARYLPEEAAP